MVNKARIAIVLTGIFTAGSVSAYELPPRPPLRVVRNVAFAEVAGQPLLADVFMPAASGRYPGVLMVHGGAWVSGAKWQMSGHARRLASYGFCVVSVSYRLAPRHQFPAQLEDVQRALSWMRECAEEYHIDPQRVVGYGYSAGAHLVSLLAMTASFQNESAVKSLQAVVAGGTPCDFRTLPAQSKLLAYFLGGSRAEVPETYRAASPAAFVSDRSPPVFFFHGDADRLVPLADVRRMQSELQEKGVSAQLMVLPRTGHLGAWMDTSTSFEIARFLRQVLD